MSAVTHRRAASQVIQFAAALFCLTCLLPTRGIAAEARLRVIEAATGVTLGEQKLDITLAVQNRAAAALPVRYEVDVLDPENTLVAHAEVLAKVEPASKSSLLPFACRVPGARSSVPSGPEPSSGTVCAIACPPRRLLVVSLSPRESCLSVICFKTPLIWK